MPRSSISFFAYFAFLLLNLFTSSVSQQQQQNLSPLDTSLSSLLHTSTSLSSLLQIYISPYGHKNTTSWWLTTPHDHIREIPSTKIQLKIQTQYHHVHEMELCIYSLYKGASTKLICDIVNSGDEEHTVILGPESGDKFYLVSLAYVNIPQTPQIHDQIIKHFRISPGPPIPKPCTSYITESIEVTDNSPLPYIPIELCEEYSMNGDAIISNWYMDDKSVNRETSYLKRSKEYIFGLMESIKREEVFYYGETDTWMYSALQRYPIKNLKVLIIGSNVPWYESMCYVYGGICTTLEYNVLEYEFEEFKSITVEDWMKGGEHEQEWDVVWSVSSFEHDGLGRYGDPLNPKGDLKAMEDCWRYLKPNGIMFLSVPVGLDEVRWNEGRVYGEKRFEKMIEGFGVKNMYGIEENGEEWKVRNERPFQPVFVLEKQEKRTSQMEL
ncbi:hypothetical protein TrLO_g13022 [Triparma laevis f. longispina]|uniref:Uncharacterized protein n=1 Tax=Triparma laevis f. longispina TaxID=1714387 RepID=A0A9W7KUZ1_9STRA|nr:hypothetical protein TrLO_g13022 [Triparma laevis f. longispina]